MRYRPPTKIFIRDDLGKRVSCRHAAALLVGYDVTDAMVRYYISANGVETLQEIRDIKARIQKHGRMRDFKRNVHLTKYGPLTLREMHARHQDKENVKLQALSSRIQLHGAMSDKVWAKSHGVAANCVDKKSKICLGCGKKRMIKFFRVDLRTKDQFSEWCADCGFDVVPVARKRKKHNVAMVVGSGQRVRSGGRLFEVVECFPVRGRKADLSCHRVMEDNGQVLRRSLWNIYGDWCFAG